LATATEEAAAPMVMLSKVAVMFESTRVSTKRAKHNSQRACRPIMSYVMKPKKNGGRTRSGRMSKSTTAVKYALAPYAPAARSRANSSRSSCHTGSEPRLMNDR
jgi:hypothetical protein